MKLKIITILTLVGICLMTVISCSRKQTCTVTEKNGIKIYKNKSITSGKKVPFTPVKKFTINSDENDKNYLAYFDLDMIGTDSKQHIYIADMSLNPKVNKYDKDGNFVTSFVGKGTGPGEVWRVSFLCTKNDTVYVGDWGNGIVSVFDDNGTFIKKLHPKGSLFQVKAVGKDRFVGSMFNGEEVDGKMMMSRKSLLLDNSLQPINVFDKGLMATGDKSDIQDEWLHMVVSNDKIYVGAHDKNIYKIKAYDFDGNQIEAITKSYASISFNRQEVDRMNKYLKKVYGNRSLNEKNVNKKHAIAGIYVDKGGNLLVQPSVDTKKSNTDGIVLDFFHDNEYHNTTKFITEEPYYHCDYSLFLKFFDDRMFVIDGEKNIVDVYEY